MATVTKTGYSIPWTRNEKIGLAVLTLASAAILAGCIYASVHMATNPGHYHGAMSRVATTINGHRAWSSVWNPNALNSAAAGSMIGQVYGYVIGSVLAGVAIAKIVEMVRAERNKLRVSRPASGSLGINDG